MLFQMLLRKACCCSEPLIPPTYAVGKLYSGFGSADAIDAYIESDGTFGHQELRYLAANATHNFHEGFGYSNEPYEYSKNDWDETAVWNIGDHVNNTYAVQMLSGGDVIASDMTTGGDPAEVIRLSAVDGSEVWRYTPSHDAQKCVHISIDESNGRVYLTYPRASAGICDAIDLSDGSLIWSITTPIGDTFVPFASTPVGNDVVFCARTTASFGPAHDLVALDGDTGTTLNSARACAVSGIPEVDRNVYGEFIAGDSSNIFVATNQGASTSHEIVCLASDLSINWRCPLDGYSTLQGAGCTLSCLVPDGTGGVILAGRFTGSINHICRIDSSGSPDYSRAFGYRTLGGSPISVVAVLPCGTDRFWAVGLYTLPEFD